MGTVQAPTPVIPIVAATSRWPDAWPWARETLAAYFGQCDLASDPFPFNQTRYYEAEMGTGLSKQLLAFTPLRDPGELTKWKHWTNTREMEFAAADHASAVDQSRPRRDINLDPGYIAEGKLVLASTKNHLQRIYLSEGIYAEVTLHYHHGRWQEFPWTYPDYRQPEYHEFFTKCRNLLRSELGRPA